MDNNYSIVEQPSVTQDIESAYFEYSRFHDIFDGMTWILSRDPYLSESNEVATGIFAIKSPDIMGDGFCSVLIVYSVENTTVTIEDIRITDTGNNNGE